MQKSFLYILIGVLLASCDEELQSTLTVKNEVTSVRIKEIYFAEQYVGYGSLLPGQTASQTYYGYEDEWPKNGQISFVMFASNGNEVFLNTDSIYTLNGDEEIEVVIDDKTPVSSY